MVSDEAKGLSEAELADIIFPAGGYAPPPPLEVDVEAKGLSEAAEGSWSDGPGEYLAPARCDEGSME